MTPTLTVRLGPELYRVDGSQSPAVIGRPGQDDTQGRPRIPINDARISREHLVLIARDGVWFAQPKGRNGVFRDGQQVSAEFEIPDDELTVVLGHPHVGIQVHFSTLDPSLVFVGQQVAQRRVEMQLSQRALAASQVINAGALIAFEKGRTWPRQKTREKLEHVLGWPTGHIETLRRQYAEGAVDPADHAIEGSLPAPEPDSERTVMLGNGGTTAVDSRYMAETIAVALSNIRSQIAGLPAETDPRFQGAVTGLISDLNRLESAAANAARGVSGARDIFVRLGEIRRVRRELVLQAARSPHATIGQRVFAARHQAELSIEEAAAMVGLSPHDLVAAEAGQPLSAQQQAALQQLLDDVG